MRQEEQTKDPCSPLDDYTSFISECSVVIEPYKQKLTSWLQKYRERLKSHYKSANSDAEKIARSDANGYRLINGYRVREIADILTVPEGTVKTYLRRGRLAIKKFLEGGE